MKVAISTGPEALALLVVLSVRRARRWSWRFQGAGPRRACSARAATTSAAQPSASTSACHGAAARTARAVPAAATVGVANTPAPRTVRAPAPPVARGRWCRPGVAPSLASSCSPGRAGGPGGDAGGEVGGPGGIPLGGIGVWSPLA
eukprot:scaffold25392_cov72-Phaeocystis_antarctica.AAC.6